MAEWVKRKSFYPGDASLSPMCNQKSQLNCFMQLTNQHLDTQLKFNNPSLRISFPKPNCDCREGLYLKVEVDTVNILTL